MIKTVQLEKKKLMDIDCMLRYMDVYFVESEVKNGVRYIADYQDFGMIKRGFLFTCPLEEVPELAELCTKGIKEEILAIFEDLKFLARRNIKYATHYSQIDSGGKETRGRKSKKEKEATA